MRPGTFTHANLVHNQGCSEGPIAHTHTHTPVVDWFCIVVGQMGLLHHISQVNVTWALCVGLDAWSNLCKISPPPPKGEGCTNVMWELLCMCFALHCTSTIASCINALAHPWICEKAQPQRDLCYPLQRSACQLSTCPAENRKRDETNSDAHQ